MMTTKVREGRDGHEGERYHEIHLRQNTPEMIALLQAKCGAYDAAQRLYEWQFGLLFVLPLASALLKFIAPAATPWVLILGAAVVVVDLKVLEPLQKEYKRFGALFQERFDCSLFQLPWRTDRIGHPPTHEVERKWALRHPTRADLVGWYPSVVERLPRQAAIAVCQRASGSWNAEMRHRYARSLWIANVALLALPVCLGLWRSESLLAVLGWIGVMAPVFRWLWREARQQTDAATAGDKVAERAQKLWQRVTVGACPSDVSAELRELQNDIYDQRRRDPQVFRWVYELYRDDDEETMQAVADRMVKEYAASINRE